MAGGVVARRVENRVIHRLVKAVGVVFDAGCDPRNFTVNCCRLLGVPIPKSVRIRQPRLWAAAVIK